MSITEGIKALFKLRQGRPSAEPLINKLLTKLVTAILLLLFIVMGLRDLAGKQISCTLTQEKLYLHQEFVENSCLNSSYLVRGNGTWQVWGDSTERLQVCFQALSLSQREPVQVNDQIK